MIAVRYCVHLDANADPKARYWFVRSQSTVTVCCTEACAGANSAPVVNVHPVKG